MPDFPLLEKSWYGATVTQWLIATATVAGVYAALVLIRGALSRRLGVVASRTATDWDDLAVEVVRRARWFFLLAVAVYAATRIAQVPDELRRVLGAVYVVAALLQAGVWGNGIIGFVADRYVRLKAGGDAGTGATIRAVGYAGRFVLWMLLVVTALQNFGVNVTALVTGLGIGGIAIALAVQNILADLFAALAIVLDKPFVVGDAIQVDDVNGTIEHIGLKTTRIRSLSGEQIVISNADLLRSRVRNYRRMEQRRALFNLELSHDTPADKIAAIPSLVRQVVESQPLARFDRSHFLAIGAGGHRIETVYFVLDADYGRYADIQQAINLEIVRRFQRDQIQFDFGTRSINPRSRTS